MPGVTENSSEPLNHWGRSFFIPRPTLIEVSQDDANVIVSKALQLACQLVVEALTEDHLLIKMITWSRFFLVKISSQHLKAFVL